MKKILFGIILALQINTAFAITISGNFSRPENSLGNDSSLDIVLTLTPSQGNIVFTRDFRISIPAGQNSVPFNITNTFSAPSYTLRYSCDSFGDRSCATENFILPGYYSENGTTRVEDSARNFTEEDNDLNSIELTAIRSEIVTGTISRPTGSNLSLSLGGSVAIFQKDENDIFRQTAGVGVDFPVGINSVDFVIAAQSVEQDEQLIVSYSCFANCSPVISPAYYTINGTVVEQDDAQLFTLAELQSSGIDLTMLAPFIISGNLFRPVGFDSNARIGLTANLLTINESGEAIVNNTDFASIDAGENSSRYFLRLESTRDLEVILSYDCFGDCDGIASPAYYNSTGTVTSIDEAQRFQLDGINNARNSVQDINITAIETTQLSGLLKRPDPSLNSQLITPSITLSTYDLDYNLINSSTQNVTIPSGSQESSFSFDIIPDDNRLYELDYQCNSCNQILNEGWYNSTGGSYIQQNSEVLFGSNDLTNINFEMVAPITVSGQFTTEGLNVNQSESVKIEVIVSNSSGAISETAEQVISLSPSGSTPFSIEIPEFENAQYTVLYSCFTCQSISTSGYFSINGTQTNEGNATRLTAQEVNNLTLEALTPNRISGTVTRENGGPNTNPLSVSVIAVSSGNDFFQTQVTIPANSNSANYTLDVSNESASEYIVSYRCNNCTSFIRSAFYSISGTINDDQQATAVLASSNINLVLLRSQIVTGQISLPNNFQLANGQSPVININVISTNANRNTIDQGVNTFRLNLNNRSRSFSVPVQVGTEYSINYTCLSDCEGLIELGQYNPTLRRAIDREIPVFITPTLISQSANFSILVKEAPPTENISLTIARPNTILANSTFDGFIRLERVNEQGQGEDSTFQNFSLSTNQTDIDIDFSVNTTEALGYRLSYNCFDCEGVIEEGFYAGNNASTSRSNDAQFISNISSINNATFSLVPSPIFRGRIFRPEESDLSEPVDVQLNLINIDIDNNFSFFNTSSSKNIVIPENETSAEFILSSTTELNTFSIVSYTLNCGSGCEENGFYNSDGTVSDFLDAERIEPRPFNDDLNLTILNKKTIEIRGTVSRPDGADNSEQFSLNINGVQLNSDGSFRTVTSIVVEIPVGADSSNFTLLVNERDFDNLILEYECRFNCPNIVQNGFYNESETTFIASKAQEINASNTTEPINFQLLNSIQFSGRITIPEGISTDIASQRRDRGVRATMRSASGEEIASFGGFIVSSSSEEFIFNVPPLIENATYELSYNCFSCKNIAEIGFFNSNGSSVFFTEAEQLSEQDLQSLSNFEMIPAEIISGTVSRPEGSSTDRPITLRVTASSIDPENQFGSFTENLFGLFLPREFSQTVIIAPSQNSTDYRLDVLPTNAYNLSYSCRNDFGTANNCQDFLRNGFYANGQITSSELGAEILNNDNDLDNIDFSLAGSDGSEITELTGIISRPNATNIENPHYIEIEVQTENDDGDFFDTTSTTVKIPENQLSTNFAIELQPNLNYRVMYTCVASCEGIAPTGYYSPISTEPSFFLSESITSSEITNIDFKLLGTINITGEIRRPAGTSNQRTLPLVITAEAFPPEEAPQFIRAANTRTVVLPRNVNSQSYSVPIVVADRYTYSSEYDCTSPSCDGFALNGFYETNSSSTVIDQDRFFWESDDSFANRNLILINTQQLTGTVFTPNQQASNDFYSVTVIARPANENGDIGSSSFSETVTISPGQISADFNLQVPELANGEYFISYICQSCNSISSNAFFSSQGTTSDIELSEGITINTLTNIELELLPSITLSGTVSLPRGTISINNNLPDSNLFDIDQVLAIALNFELLDSTGDTINTITEEINFFIQRDFNGDISLRSKIGALIETFSLTLPDNQDLDTVRLSYSCTNCSKILSLGYYTELGSVEIENQAQLIEFANNDSINFELIPDSDNDGISNENDNCPSRENPNQTDSDGDSIGDLCDGDADGDNVSDVIDNCPTTPNPNQNIDACQEPEAQLCFPIKAQNDRFVTVCL